MKHFSVELHAYDTEAGADEMNCEISNINQDIMPCSETRGHPASIVVIAACGICNCCVESVFLLNFVEETSG